MNLDLGDEDDLMIEDDEGNNNNSDNDEDENELDSMMSEKGSPVREGSSSLSCKRTRRKKRLRLPTAREMALLPTEIRDGILQRVYTSLSNTLYARMAYLVRRNTRQNELRRSSGPAPEKVQASFLQSIPVFSTWVRLEALADAAQLLVVPKGTVIVHAGDFTDRAMYILVSGTLQIRPQRLAGHGGARSRKGCDMTAVIRSQEPMSCVREHAFLALELPRDYIRTATPCVLWKFSEQLLNSTLAQQTEERQLAARAAALEERRSLIPLWAPLTTSQLARIALFSEVPKDLLASLVLKCVPRTVVAHETLSGFNVTDPKPSEMLLLLRGTVVATTHTGRTFTPPVGALLQVMPVLFPKKQPLLSLRTATICDFWAIPREGLSVACGSKIDAMQSILKSALDDEDLRAQRSEYYRAYVATIPFVSQIGTSALIDDLVAEFKENVYPAGSSIISTSETCSGLIIPIRGMARISVSGGDLCIGECIGFACLAPHRWTYHVTARDAVETIELPRDVFAAILEKHKLLQRLFMLSMGLLFPVAHPELFSEALSMIDDLLNPPTFPISESSSAPKLDAARVAAVTDRPSVSASALLSRKGKSALKEGAAPPKVGISAMSNSEARQALDDIKERRGSTVMPPLQRVPIAERLAQQVAAAKERDIQMLAAASSVDQLDESYQRARPAKNSRSSRGKHQQVALPSSSAADEEVHLDGTSSTHAAAAKKKRSTVDSSTQTDKSFIADRNQVLLEMLQ